MKLNKIIYGLVLSFSLASQAGASLVISDSLSAADLNGDGEVNEVVVSLLEFSVLDNTTATFDVLAAEYLFGNQTDLNGDGEITGFDSKFWIYDIAGNNYIGGNDEDFYNLGKSDGSINMSDSFAEVYFSDAGRYLLGIGLADFTYKEMMRGYQNNAYLFSNITLDKHYETADWQLTINVLEGDIYDPKKRNPYGEPPEVAEVSEPSTLAILGMGLLGAGFLRKKRQRG